jgi:hypothetical protein
MTAFIYNLVHYLGEEQQAAAVGQATPAAVPDGNDW